MRCFCCCCSFVGSFVCSLFVTLFIKIPFALYTFEAEILVEQQQQQVHTYVHVCVCACALYQTDAVMFTVFLLLLLFFLL